MTRWNRAGGIALLGPLALALLTACGGGSAQTSGSGEPDKSGAVVYSHTIPPTSYDPHKALSDNDTVYLRQVYDTLTDVDKAGKPVPMLAESWELASDGSTLTFVLRDDATFSDGSPVDAEAVKANIDRLVSDESLTVGRQVREAVASVEATDPHTVVLHLKGEGGSLPLVFAGRSGMMVSPDAFDNPDLDQKPVGAGALELTASTPGASYEYTRRDDYWDDEAYRIGTMKIVVQPDSAQAMSAVQSGQASMMLAGTGDLAKEAEAAGLKVFSRKEEPVDFYRLAMNTNRGELGKREVRQAISSAIDRDAIGEGVFSGLCPARVNPFPEDYFAHGAKGNAEEWGYDADRARKLLTDAGLPDGFTMELGTIPTTGMQALAQVVQADLKKVGIDAKIVTLDSTQLRSKFASGDLDSALGLILGPTDPSSFYADNLAPGTGLNPGGLTDAKVESLVPATRASDDPEELAKAYVPFMDALFEMGPSLLPICGWQRGEIARPEVKGMDFKVTGGLSFRSVYVTK